MVCYSNMFQLALQTLFDQGCLLVLHPDSSGFGFSR